jgi:hypothetical protein
MHVLGMHRIYVFRIHVDPGPDPVGPCSLEFILYSELLHVFLVLWACCICVIITILCETLLNAHEVDSVKQGKHSKHPHCSPLCSVLTFTYTK